MNLKKNYQTGQGKRRTNRLVTNNDSSHEESRQGDLYKSKSDWNQWHYWDEDNESENSTEEDEGIDNKARDAC